KRDIDFIHSIEVDNAWNALLKRKRRHQRKRMMRYVGYAATIIFVACAWIWFSPLRTSEAPPSSPAGNVFHNDVMPGQNKAQLVLSNGQKVDMQADANTLQEQDGTQILGNNGSLTYETTGDTDEDLIYNTLVIPKAGMYQVVLSDGSKVWLNAMSELRF